MGGAPPEESLWGRPRLRRASLWRPWGLGRSRNAMMCQQWFRWPPLSTSDCAAASFYKQPSPGGLRPRVSSWLQEEVVTCSDPKPFRPVTRLSSQASTASYFEPNLGSSVRLKSSLACSSTRKPSSHGQKRGKKGYRAVRRRRREAAPGAGPKKWGQKQVRSNPIEVSFLSPCGLQTWKTLRAGQTENSVPDYSRVLSG